MCQTGSTLTTELESRWGAKLALRADIHQLAPALSAELHSLWVLKLTIGTLYDGVPYSYTDMLCYFKDMHIVYQHIYGGVNKKGAKLYSMCS
jgi:hypothetical protein